MSTSDMNRDESQRCVQLAVKCMEGGNEEKAIRLLQKSIRLCPNSTAQGLLNEIQKLKNEASQQEPAASDEKENQKERNPSGGRTRSRSPSGTRQRKKANHSSQASPEYTESRPGSDSHKDYSDEQLQAVLRVKKCTTFYQVLFMEKDSFSEVILKKQYRKLALVLHPDKNKAP
ncbi:putative DnaJ-like protein subfamily B member 14, partial [Hypsibius exemplaris]